METLQQLYEAESKLEQGDAYVRHDPQYHSERFEYILINNAQKIFFERLNGDIVIVAAGYASRNWKERLEEMEAHINRQITIAQRLREKK